MKIFLSWSLIDKIKITYLERFDGIGISASQIGVPLRIVAVQFTK